MDSHRRALLSRAAATAAALVMFGTAAQAASGGGGPAGPAGPATPAEDHDGCRAYAPMAHPYVKITAEDNEFDAHCLMAPANRTFRIYLRNNDAAPHNISIYSADPAKDKKAEHLFEGKAIKGPGQEEYAVDALPPGEYHFQDDKLPDMFGEIEVPDPKK